MHEADFAKRKIDLEDGLDPMMPVTHPHVGEFLLLSSGTRIVKDKKKGNV